MVTTWIARASFRALHSLDWWGSEHECARKHGHLFTVTVECSREHIRPNDVGTDASTVVDLAALRDELWAVCAGLNGKYLNSIIPDGNASVEGICDYITHLLSKRAFLVASVEVWEDDATGARRAYV